MNENHINHNQDIGDLQEENKSFLRRVFLNLLIICFILISYFYFSESFGSISSPYISNTEFSLVFGMSLLLLTFLALLAGPYHAFISGFLGEFLYQLSYYDQIYLEWAFIVGIYGLMCGIYRYKPNKYTKKPINIYYTFIALLIASTLTMFLIILFQLFLLPVNLPLNDILIAYGFKFLIQALVSVIFIIPFLLWVYDKIFADEKRIVYNMMLTHHPMNASDHTFYLKFGKTRIFFCSRCSGVILGGLMGIFAFHIIELIFGYIMSPETAVLLCILLPIPGLTDWGTQRLLMRTSDTNLRLFTGFLIGLALHILNFTEDYYFLMIFIIIFYFSILGVLMYLGSKREIKRMRERAEKVNSERNELHRQEDLREWET